jgi:predicted metal-dependent hydrolase
MAVRGVAPQLPLFPEQDEPGFEAGFEIRVSARARRLSIKVFPRGRVEVVVPKRTRPGDVQSFVNENSEWIRRARESFALKHPPEPFRLPESIELRGLDRTVSVRYEPRPGSKSVRFRSSLGAVILSGRIGNEKLSVKALKRWLASVAKKEFEPKLRALSELTQTPYNKLQVRAQRTCWGSRSSSGTISLNLCLLFLEPELLRYLMIHELCHGKHMNHSKSFWRFVGRFEPDFRRLDRELTECWNRVPNWMGIY